MTAAAFSKDIGGEPLRLWHRVLAYAILVSLMVTFVWVAEERPFTPGSTVGYNLGLAGGLMMLSLLLYPVRKYWRRLERVGSLRAWFIVHIAFGICGPVLVLMHSTFALGSFNASVAFWSMVIVALSGLAGRYIFTQLYFELGQRQMRQLEAQRALNQRPDGGTHALDYAPEVLNLLDGYRDAAYSVQLHRWQQWVRMIAGYWFGRRFIRRCDREIQAAIAAQTRSQGWSPGRASGEFHVLHELVGDYVNAVDQAARFTMLVNALSWWQLAHVPFVYILALSGIAHVVAVHMY
jgi:hypothetical protein